ncbi:hypothetical protein [Crateriforma spongiae]|uniref:hypothetical protein n=1 Tax=Crateriforma spongiae TaxID=2724528 RepID=UPI001446447C|nr:hypothetical protein [Crateriforma spongiae]
MSWLRSSDVTRSFVGPVLAFVACGLMLTMWWHPVSSTTSSKQQASLFLKTQVIDAGRHRPGDRVDVTFAIQNASDRQATIVPRTACDCVSTSGDRIDVQPGTVHDASFRWTIGTPMLGDYGVCPMSQTIEFIDRVSHQVITGEVRADVERPMFIAAQDLQVESVFLPGQDKLLDGKSEGHPIPFACVGKTEKIICQFETKQIESNVNWQPGKRTGEITFHPPLSSELGSHTVHAKVHWTGHTDRDTKQTLVFPMAINIRSRVPVEVTPAIAVLSPSHPQTMVRFVAVTEGIKLTVQPETLKMPSGVKLIDSGNQWLKLQLIEAEPLSSKLTEDEPPSTIDVQIVNGQSKGTYPVRFSLLILP